MTGWNLIVVPGAERALVTAALRSHLARGAPYRESLPPVEHVDGHSFVGVSPEPEEGSAEVFACYQRQVFEEAPPVTILEMNGRWDCRLAAELSRASGGVAIAVEYNPHACCSGICLCFAGVLVEQRGRNWNESDDEVEGQLDVDVELRRMVGAVMNEDSRFVSPAMWPEPSSPVDLLRAVGRTPRPREALPDSSLRCAFFGYADARDFRRIVGEPWAASSHIMNAANGIPYGVIVGAGPSDAEALMRIRDRIGTVGLAFELPQPAGEAPSWWSGGPRAQSRSGRIDDGQGFLRYLTRFAELTGVRTADVRLPSAFGDERRP